MYHKVRSIKELAVSARKALTSKSSGGEGCAAGQGQDGKCLKRRKMSEGLAKVEPETAQGKGSILGVPRDNRGDDYLYRVFTAERLRRLLRERGVVKNVLKETSNSEDYVSPYMSPYETGSGVVLSTSNNPDRITSSRVHLYGGFWDNGADPGSQVDGCVTQWFSSKRTHEAAWAYFEGLPLGKHTYALGIGYRLESGSLLLTVRGAYLPTLLEYRDHKALHMKLEPPLKRGMLTPAFSRMTALGVKFLLPQPPVVAVFEYERKPRQFAVDVTLEVEVPDISVQHAVGCFHHIQLVQID